MLVTAGPSVDTGVGDCVLVIGGTEVGVGSIGESSPVGGTGDGATGPDELSVKSEEASLGSSSPIMCFGSVGTVFSPEGSWTLPLSW